MLEQLNSFRALLSDVMMKCIHRRIILYGNGRSGQFVKWYAKYYHNIDVDYEIDLNCSIKIYEWPILAPQLFDFNYKDVHKCAVWLTEPIDKDLIAKLETAGYKKNEDYFNFMEMVYSGDYYSQTLETDPFKKKKDGKRDIQFMEWLEWKYDCNLLTAIYDDDLDTNGTHYCISTQREIFSLLDLCHIDSSIDNGIFDFGCGKGGPIISFIDYGFRKVGGVEYEKRIYDIAKENMRKLQLDAEIICGDAADVIEELDAYNYFYFYHPFYENTYKKCIDNIVSSINRIPRKIFLILFIPYGYKYIEECGYFRLRAQTLAPTWLKVVNIYESV